MIKISSWDYCILWKELNSLVVFIFSFWDNTLFLKIALQLITVIVLIPRTSCYSLNYLTKIVDCNDVMAFSIAIKSVIFPQKMINSYQLLVLFNIKDSKWPYWLFFDKLQFLFCFVANWVEVNIYLYIRVWIII